MPRPPLNDAVLVPGGTHPTVRKDFETGRRFFVLDAMRGYAACVIMILHYQQSSGNGSYLLTSSAYIAVDFFLLLSGFILNHAYFQNSSTRLFPFVAARFARLYPLHVVTFLITAGLFTVFETEWFRRDFALHLMMIHNVGLGPDRITFNGPAWSISVEFWVNVITAVLVVLAAKLKLPQTQRRLVFLAIALVCYAAIWVSQGHLNAISHNIAPFLNSGLLRGMASFCLGVLLYDAAKALGDRRSARKDAALQWATPLALLLFGGLLLMPFGETSLDFAIIVVLAGILVIASQEVGPAARFARLAAPIGTISFSIYLTHQPLQYLFDHLTPDFYGTFAGFVSSSAVCVVISIIAYSVLERPAYRAIKRLFASAMRRGQRAWGTVPRRG